MEYIAIRWDSGFMDIILDAFFPASATRVRKLLRIIELDYAHRDALLNQVLQYCTERAQRTMDSRQRTSFKKDAEVITSWMQLKNGRTPHS